MMHLALILLTWNIGWAPNNARKWQMGFNSAVKGLNEVLRAELEKLMIMWGGREGARTQAVPTGL
jgi:hypothetical protein